MKTHLRKLWDSLQSSYWFLPLVMMSFALILWWGTGSLDNILSARDKKTIAWLYISNADTMRTLLLSIAVAIIGVVGVVFTIIMVPLSIAASQFGPRLLRTFLRDTGTQVTLGIFNATFIFCMAVLLQLSDDVKQPLPQISVNVALLLGLISFGMLIYFISHIAVSLQAPVVVARVSKELHAAISHDIPDNAGSICVSPNAKKSNLRPDPDVTHKIIVANQSGYLQVRDDEALLHLATKHNLIIQVLNEPGDFVVKDTPLVKLWPEDKAKNIVKTIHNAFVIGVQRTLVQDVTFGINELVEVSLRALSPAINDPFTAVTCLDWIGSALCGLCTRNFPMPELLDKEGNLRVIRNPVTFTILTDAAFHQIREYGRTSRAVTIRIMDTIKLVAGCTTTAEQRSILLYHAALVEAGCHIGLPEAADRQVISEEYEKIKTIINGKIKNA